MGWGGRGWLALGVGLQPHLLISPPVQVARQEGRVILTSGLPYHKVRTHGPGCPPPFPAGRLEAPSSPQLGVWGLASGPT